GEAVSGRGDRAAVEQDVTRIDREANARGARDLEVRRQNHAAGAEIDRESARRNGDGAVRGDGAVARSGRAERLCSTLRRRGRRSGDRDEHRERDAAPDGARGETKRHVSSPFEYMHRASALDRVFSRDAWTVIVGRAPPRQ